MAYKKEASPIKRFIAAIVLATGFYFWGLFPFSGIVFEYGRAR